MSELISLENERREKLFLEEEARAELFRRVGTPKKLSLIKIIETLDTGSQVSAEMSDHALICCAVRTRTGEPREQRTDLGLVKL